MNRKTLISPTHLRTVAAVSVAAVGLGTGTAHAAPAPEPTPQAKQQGVSPGDAFMGWKTPKGATAPQSSTKASATSSTLAASSVPGIDVSGHQGNVDWAGQWSAGKRFAYVKATEGTGFRNSSFAQQYNGSHDIGMKRGAYHFGLPNGGTGKAQAEFFVKNGGGWSKDGKTLPGVLDVEYNPYGSNACYGLSQSQMVSWIKSFTSRYKALTGRDAVIYTTTGWWKSCTGNSSAFASSNPLWLARYASSPGTLPAGWGFHTFWQYSDTPIDQNVFNGSSASLTKLANG